MIFHIGTDDVAALRGPPGRDGRDGRDGKDCDLSDIQRLATLLSHTSSSNSTSVSAGGNKQHASKFDEGKQYTQY